MNQFEILRQAGFNDETISAHYRQKLSAGGFSDTEINAWIEENSGKKIKSLNGDEQSPVIKEIAKSAENEETPEDNDVSFKRLLELGWQQSVAGMVKRGKLPDELTSEEINSMGIFDRAVMSVASVVPDLPIFAAGAKVGAVGGGAVGAGIGSVVPIVGTTAGGAFGGLMGSGAGAFGFHAMARQILVDAYSRGEVMSADELMYRVKNASKEFLKGSAIGAVTSGFGMAGKTAAGGLTKVAAATESVAAKTALTTTAKVAPVASEIFGLTTASAGVEARMPTAQDFVDCAATIGLLKLTYATPGRVKKATAIQLNKLKNEALPRLYKQFVKTGKTPEQIIGEAANDPIKMQELFDIKSIKDGYERTVKDPFGGIPTDEYARFLENYIIQKGAAIKDKDGNVVVKGRQLFKQKGTKQNFGFTKAIFKHDMKVEDMIKLPEIIRNYEPSEIVVRDAEIGKIVEEYRVPISETENYRVAFRKENDNRYLLSVFLEKKENGQIYSQKKSVLTEQQGPTPSTEQSTAGDYYFVPDAEHSLNSNIARNEIEINPDGKVMPDGQINAADAVKISDVMKQMENAVKVPVRLGKINGRKEVAGQYYPKEEMIRLRKANDIATLSHEVGHHLEKIVFGRVGSDVSKTYYDELSAIASKAKSQSKRAVGAEGFAEFVAGYVTNPKSVAEKCPKFFKFFESEMGERAPDFMNMLKNAQESVDAWAKQPDLMQVLSHVAVEAQKGTTPLSEKMTKAKNTFIDNVLDDLAPLGRVSEKLGIDKLDDNSPYYRARMLRGTVDSISNYSIEESQIDYYNRNIGKSLKQILSPIKENKQMNELIGYLTAARAVELDGRGIETGIPAESAQRTVEALKTKYEPVAKELYRFQKNVIQYAVDGGLISQESAESMAKVNQAYVPFRRVMENDFDNGIGVRKMKPKQTVKTIKGSTRDIENPLKSIIKNTYQIIGNVEKNRVARAVADLSLQDKSGEFVFKVKKNSEKIKQPADLKIVREDKNGNIEFVEDAWVQTDKINERNQIIAYKNGVGETYEVAPEIAKIINNLSPIESNWLLRSMGLISKSLRLGATGLNAGFAIKNTIRDTTLATISTETNYGLTKIPTTVFSMIRNDKYYKAYKKSGASMATFLKYDSSSLDAQLRDLTSTGYFDDVWNCFKTKDAAGILTKGVIDPLTTSLAWLGDKSETMTRFGEFKQSMKGKEFTRENIERAGFNAREVTLDFAKGGASVKWANQFTAFLNANVLGTAKSVEVLAKHPIRAVGILGTLGVLNALKNWDWENWGVDEDIENVLRVQRNTNYVFTVPYKNKETGRTDNAIIRVPKAQQIGWVSTAFEETTYQFLSAMKGKEREDFIDTLASSFWGELNLAPIPNAILTPIELLSNHSIYSGKKIVPAAQEKILPEYQYLEQTTEAAKSLSRGLAAVFGDDNTVSPIKMEYLLRGWTGAAGTGVLRGIDYVGRKAGVFEDNKPADMLADLPFIRAFIVRNPSANTENIAKFYEKAEKAEQYVETLTAEKRRMNFDTVQNKSFWSAYQAVVTYKKNLSGLTALARNIQNSDMTKNEKRQMMDNVYIQMNKIAKEGLELNKAIEKNMPR